MTKLEKALENIEDVKRVLIQEFCPAFFGLKNNCNIARDCELKDGRNTYKLVYRNSMKVFEFFKESQI